MVARRDSFSFAADPRALLGVGAEATDQEIRQAYLDKTRAHPPERDPEAFEKIRDAYELLRDPRRRAALVLAAPDPAGPLTDLLGAARAERNFVGSEPWLEVIRRSTGRA